ncbi:diguanylate cyclase (GGDEF) domain-containing protein [Halomonas sp. HL-93]|nr:MAG: diguanylate cyclase with 7 TM signaling domain [Halomonas sp. HL-93]SBR46961.1 diguanylate cyclase (GGDEF) domain-containing protein [Halomonas sp. HL-93]SNY98996.1 diguanylate cyclase (GGDEF) domain-containing protein [Halomonas sp. hl-4]
MGLFVLFVGWVACWQPAFASLSTSHDQSRYSLTSHTQLWHSDESLTLNELLERDPPFTRATHKSDLNFGYTPNDIWLRTQIENPTAHSQHWIVEFEYPFLDRVTLNVLREHFSESMISGSAVPREQRALAHRQPVFPLNLAPGETVTLYALVNAAGSKMLNYNLLSEQTFFQQNDRHNFWLATYFGMLLALGLYNLLLFFGLKERVFLYYSLFALGFTVAILTFNGIGTLMFWSALSENTSRLVAIGFTFASTMGTLFAQSFLNTKGFTPRWHRALNYFRGYCSLALLATLVLPIQPALRLMDVTGFMAALLMLICGIYCISQRVPSARIFVLAWSLFLVGACVFALRNLGILPANFITLHGIQIGSAIEMLLLSFALAARFNKLKRQKERAQADMLMTLKRQEAVLEQKVADRTKALELLATRDVLTGLLNRKGLADCAAKALKRSEHTGQPVALFMLDLDLFKPINDQYGHEAGDFVLQQVARRIEHLARAHDHCARFGGDEFIILLEGIADHNTLNEIRHRLNSAIRAPIKLPCGELVSVGVSIGMSVCQGDNKSLESLLREADGQMYDVKARRTDSGIRYGSAQS